MQSIVVVAENKADIRFLTELIEKLGYKGYSLSKTEQQMLARLRLIDLAAENQSVADATPSEIDAIVEQVRSQRHAKKKTASGR